METLVAIQQCSWAAVARRSAFPQLTSQHPQSRLLISGDLLKDSQGDTSSAMWLSQARQSPVDPSTGKVKCRACGVAFTSYSSLAQHLGSKHAGLNSEDSKFAQLLSRPSASQKQELPTHESHDSMFPVLSASRPQMSAERLEASSTPVHATEGQHAVKPTNLKSSQTHKLSDLFHTADPTSATPSPKKHVGISKHTAKLLMSNTLQISVKSTKTKKTPTGLQRGGSAVSSAGIGQFVKQRPGDKHGKRSRMDLSAIPEGLRLRGAHKPHVSKLKQQVEASRGLSMLN
jgi:hypothetical protein